MKMINEKEYRRLQRLLYDLTMIVEGYSKPNLDTMIHIESQVDEFVPMDMQLEFRQEG